MNKFVKVVCLDNCDDESDVYDDNDGNYDDDDDDDDDSGEGFSCGYWCSPIKYRCVIPFAMLFDCRRSHLVLHLCNWSGFNYDAYEFYKWAY